MNRYVYRAGLLALLPLLTPEAWAARECEFNSGSATVSSVRATDILRPTGKVSSATLLVKDVEATYNGEFWSHCEAGNDGQDLWGEINVADSGYMWHEPGALFPTNIPGIRYSVHVKPREKPSVADGYLPNSSMFSQVADIGDGPDDENGPLDGGSWDIYLDFYQTAEYGGNQGQSKVYPAKNSRLGSYRLGGSQHDGQTVAINVNTSSFSVDITTATCASAVTNVSNSTIDFGDVNLADLAADRGPEKKFSINLSGCSLLNGVTTKLTTFSASEDGNMIANGWVGQPGDATGVGVKILDANNKLLRPNDPNSSSVVSGLKMPGSVKLNYTAQLRADGKTRKAGGFQASAVLSLTYQ